MKHLHLTNRGDTIVEVMISIAIIGAVLAGAYASANRSSDNNLDAQEREVAITVAQSQLEQLNNLNSTTLNAINTATSDGAAACFNASGVLVTDATTYANDCVNYDTATYPEQFTVAIKKSPTTDQPLATYEVSVNWSGPNGSNDNVQMYYQPAGSQ